MSDAVIVMKIGIVPRGLKRVKNDVNATRAMLEIESILENWPQRYERNNVEIPKNESHTDVLKTKDQGIKKGA